VSCVVSYGVVDADYGMRLRAGSGLADGPFYMLSLTRFLPGSGQILGRSSSQDPDSAYVPIEFLRAAGATLCFVADVVAGPDGFDRVGVIRYPTRRAFIELQDSSDTKDWIARKAQRAERLIMLGLNPVGALPAAQHQRVLVEVWAGSAPEPNTAGTATGFAVEGTYIGDGRQWSGARYTPIDPGTALPLEPARFGYLAVLVEPVIERWM
jgi:hypothetical protein